MSGVALPYQKELRIGVYWWISARPLSGIDAKERTSSQSPLTIQSSRSGCSICLSTLELSGCSVGKKRHNSLIYGRDRKRQYCAAHDANGGAQ